MLHDVRYALRAFWGTPGFTVAVVLSIAIGVGANTAIFSVASALLLRPLPYQDASRLVILWNRSPGLGISEDWFSTAQYFDIRNGHQAFEQVAIAIGGNYNLTGDGEPERIGTIRVSSNLLPMLGVRPLHGRFFEEPDDRPGRAGTAVLGHGTWMRRYGGDPAAIGRSLTLNGMPYEVVGVLPPSFSLPREVMPTLGGAENAEIVLPLPLPADAARIRNREDYNILGRLKPGVSIERAQREMDTITARLRDEHPAFYPPNGGLTFSVVPLREYVVGGARRSLYVLAGAVAFVLLIACANVANLLLSRGLARGKEIAVRAALGASRVRIVRQLLTESVLLALAGATLGLVLAAWTLDGIRMMGSRSVPRLHEIAIDSGVLFFTLAVAAVSGILFGLAPAVRLARVHAHGLRDGGRGSSGTSIWGRGHNVRRVLVVAELALSIVLLVGAGLLIRSFDHLQRVPPGFNPASVLTLELTMTGRKYGDAEMVLETYRLLWDGLRSLPGVTAAGGVSALPLSQMMAWGPITVEGRTPPAGEKFINVDIRLAGGDYFAAMEIPLKEGRLFNEHDTRAAQRVVLIDEHMAARLWPGENPVGRRIRTGGFDATANTPWLTVVGVVGRVKQDGLDTDPRMALYHPHTQAPGRAMNVVLRTRGDPAALTAAATRRIRELDPDLPIYNVRTMKTRVDESLAPRRFSMLLLTLFAAVALGLAAIGTYGVMAYVVSQGTREVGIRMALGATPRAILVLVLGQGMAVTLAGLAIGLAGAHFLMRVMAGLLFGVRPSDPLTFIAIALVLGAIALLATYLPARRAARIDPMISLRCD
ncbi:MAG TPA: ABC transporter permease [Vicinamibacterales bacterium]|nr:ABC transporter permease [Vicinamibacterales bacterium]